MRARRLTLVTCGTIVAAALFAAVFWQVRFKTLPFDSAGWRSDSHGEAGMRWRMRADTLRMLQAGEIATAGDVDRLLGPSSVGNAFFRRYRLGGRFPMPIDSWWLDVALDTKGRVVANACVIRPG